MANLNEFFNKISYNNRIFSREDIANMSDDEFSENEKAIDFQLANLGVPTNEQLAQSNDTVYVKAYTRADGTQVKAHFRSKSPNITGAAANIDRNSSYLQSGIGIFDNNNVYNNIDLNFNYKDTLKDYNHKQNLNYSDARDMMDIAIDGPKNIHNTDDYKFVSSQFNEKLSKELNVKIPKNWDGIVYNADSNLSKSIANSPEFLQQVAKQKSSNFSKSSFQISLNKDTNLFRSIHNATVLNPHIDKDGYFNAVIFDLYDFKHMNKPLYDENLKPTIAAKNNVAWGLQWLGIIKNYYVLIPIKTKLPF